MVLGDGCDHRSTDPKTQASFVFRNTNGLALATLTTFEWRSGLPTLCISAMILVALQNNCLIDVLCNRKYFLCVKLIFSLFIFP